jgi:hypothetical protein
VRMLSLRYNSRAAQRQLLSAAIADNTGNVQSAARGLAGADTVGCVAHRVQLVANHSLSPCLDGLFARVNVRFFFLVFFLHAYPVWYIGIGTMFPWLSSCHSCAIACAGADS